MGRKRVGGGGICISRTQMSCARAVVVRWCNRLGASELMRWRAYKTPLSGIKCPPCQLQASAGLKLYYTSGLQGEAPEVITIGRPSAGELQAACILSATDVVESGANYDNNRCGKGDRECRWGKLEL